MLLEPRVDGEVRGQWDIETREERMSERKKKTRTTFKVERVITQHPVKRVKEEGKKI